MQLNGPFTLFMLPALISTAFNLRQYFATHAVRFYVEAGLSIQFPGRDNWRCWRSHLLHRSGYYLDLLSLDSRCVRNGNGHRSGSPDPPPPI